MKKILSRLLMVVGALALLAVVAGSVVALVAQRARTRLPGKVLLEVNLERALPEYVPDDPVAQLMSDGQPTLRSTVEALHKAADDPRVTGLVATLGAAPLGMGQVQELRDAVLAFRAKKKPALAFSETFGEVGPGNGAYYLATAFDEVWLQPSGDVGLTGTAFVSPFVRGTLDKLGVVPRMDHRHEYKNAMNVFTERSMTPPHREAMARISASWMEQMTRGIAAGRRLDEPAVRALVDRGPFLGREAVEAKLVDGLAYRDEVYDKAKQKAGKDAELLFLGKYREKAGSPWGEGQAIALVYGVGGVQRGKSDFNPFTGETSMGSATVAAALRAAIDDKDVKAIVFRIDSPGGSYVASDTIWRETQRARKAGKPVIASMGNIAGSGGYFVAMGCDKIVAQPATITGSIGVLGGKMVMTGLTDKLGLSFDEVHDGRNARIWSSQYDYSPEEWARFQAWLDRVYDDFTSKVAEGRKLPRERVLELAKGRIWTGEDAKARGLVDELGGLPAAIRLARQAAHIPDSAGVELRPFPRPKSPIQMLLERQDSSDKAAVAALARGAEELQPVFLRLRALGLVEQPGVLTMPPLEWGR